MIDGTSLKWLHNSEPQVGSYEHYSEGLQITSSGVALYSGRKGSHRVQTTAFSVAHSPRKFTRAVISPLVHIHLISVSF